MNFIIAYKYKHGKYWSIYSSFSEAFITLTHKSDEEGNKTKLAILINVDIKISNKVFAHQLWNLIEIIFHYSKILMLFNIRKLIYLITLPY